MKIRTIKELLEIDIEFLYENSVSIKVLIDELNDTRNFLLFELNSKFFKIFNQFQISIFNGNALHIEFISSNCSPCDLRKLLNLIVDEYGTDENNMNVADWNTLKHMSWWFKNIEHDQTYDDYENTDELYYGIMIDGINDEQISLSLLNYSNIDKKLNSKNWLQR